MYANHLKTIYKFYSINKFSLESLSYKSFYAPHYTKLNDPFDCQINPSQFLTVKNFLNICASRYGVRSKRYKDLIKMCLIDGIKFRTELQRRINKEIKHFNEFTATNGIISLTVDRCNVLLWSHYADGHQGFCVAFERNCKNVFGQKDKCHTVDYIRNFHEQWFFDVFDEPEGFFTSRAISTKSKHWKYEREWRLFGKPADTYIAFGENVKQIIFGANCKKRNENRIRNITRDWGITYAKAVLNRPGFNLRFEKI